MPRSLQEILDHADELAERMADYEPTDEQLAVAGELADLHRAVLAVAAAERATVDAIVAARAKGAIWDDIGAVLGTTGEAARQRYAKTVAATPVSPSP
jgi:hypothetical protein